MASSNMQFEMFYLRLHTLGENHHGLVTLLETLRASTVASVDEFMRRKMRVARIENQIRGVNVQMSNLWDSYMERLATVSETYTVEAKRKEEEAAAAAAVSRLRKLVRKMGSRS